MQWLKRRINEAVTITKREQEDLDEIRLELDDVALRKSKHFDAEHYARDEAILLRGFGQVISDHGDPAPLPLDTFEIPLEGKVIAETADDRLQITTDRAQYMFTRDR